MTKNIFTIFLTATAITAVAQQKYEVGKPGNEAYRYLDEYHALKEYID